VRRNVNVSAICRTALILKSTTSLSWVAEASNAATGIMKLQSIFLSFWIAGLTTFAFPLVTRLGRRKPLTEHHELNDRVVVLETEMKEIRNIYKELKGEIKESSEKLSKDFKDGMKELREDVKGDNKELSKEIKSAKEEHSKEIKYVNEKLSKEIKSVSEDIKSVSEEIKSVNEKLSKEIKSVNETLVKIIVFLAVLSTLVTGLFK
jgi:DNA repair exonuclease SbcCD ATPase subunit